MDELRLTGNCLKGSRPLLSFDANFDSDPKWQLLKEVFTQVFNTPRGHPKSQPFHDHVLSFHIADEKVWLRHYQVLDHATEDKDVKKLSARGEETTELVEIGPRCVLQVIRIFAGSMGGPTLYENPDYVSPNALRHVQRLSQGQRFVQRAVDTAASKERAKSHVLPADPLKFRNLFKKDNEDAAALGAVSSEDDEEDATGNGLPAEALAEFESDDEGDDSAADSAASDV